MNKEQYEILLEEDNVRNALNLSENLDDFQYHWCNWELTYVTGIRPSKGLYENLKKYHRFESLEPGYFTHWTHKIRRIVDNKQYEKINGQEVDLWTANIMVQVLDKLNDKNKQKFIKMDFPVAHHVAMGLVNKAGA